MHKLKLYLTCAAATSSILLLVMSSSATARSETVSGSFADPAPPILTSYQPSNGTATTGAYTGYDATVWSGTLTGVTHLMIRGTVNLVTGDSSGTFDETFIGRSSDGGNGSLHLAETYTVNGATMALRIEAKILSGTGDFAGSSGEIVFTGISLPSGQGEGTYAGIWNGPGPQSGSRSQTQPPSAQSSHCAVVRLHVGISPRSVKAGHAERFRFRVSAGGRPVAHASVTLDGRRALTNRMGRATIRLALAHPGRYRVLAQHTGMTLARTSVRATP